MRQNDKGWRVFGGNYLKRATFCFWLWSSLAKQLLDKKYSKGVEQKSLGADVRSWFCLAWEGDNFRTNKDVNAQCFGGSLDFIPSILYPCGSVRCHAKGPKICVARATHLSTPARKCSLERPAFATLNLFLALACRLQTLASPQI